MAYVRTRLGRWFYEEHGSTRKAGDPCIVLLHGLLFDGGMWNACVGPLAERPGYSSDRAITLVMAVMWDAIRGGIRCRFDHDGVAAARAAARDPTLFVENQNTADGRNDPAAARVAKRCVEVR